MKNQRGSLKKGPVKAPLSQPPSSRPPVERAPLPSKSPRKDDLLAVRFLNSLPFAGSVKDIYLGAKHSGELFNASFNLVESVVVLVASPLVERYIPVDDFLSHQLESVAITIDRNVRPNVPTAISYPIGYSVGMAKLAKEKISALASPIVEKAYDVADVIVDNLMPSETDETLEEEYSKFSILQQKNPLRRLRKRANLRSIAYLPISSVFVSYDLSLTWLNFTLGLGSTILDRVVNSLMQFSNFENLFTAATLLRSGDVGQIFQTSSRASAMAITGILEALIERAYILSRQCERRNLPYHATIPGAYARFLKGLRNRLAKLADIEVTPEEDEETPLLRKEKRYRSRSLNSPVPHSHRFNDTERMPTMISGENTFDIQQKELEDQRMPTFWYNELRRRVREEIEHEEAERAIKRRVGEGHTENGEFAHQHEAKKGKIEISIVTGGEVDRHAEEERKDPKTNDLDEHGFKFVAPDPHHKHTIPYSAAKHLGKDLTHPDSSTIPLSSPLLVNNPFASIAGEEGVKVKLEGGDPFLTVQKEVEANQLEEERREEKRREIQRKVEEGNKEMKLKEEEPILEQRRKDEEKELGKKEKMKREAEIQKREKRRADAKRKQDVKQRVPLTEPDSQDQHKEIPLKEVDRTGSPVEKKEEFEAKEPAKEEGRLVDDGKLLSVAHGEGETLPSDGGEWKEPKRPVGHTEVAVEKILEDLPENNPYAALVEEPKNTVNMGMSAM